MSLMMSCPNVLVSIGRDENAADELHIEGFQSPVGCQRMVQFVHEDFLLMHYVGGEGCVVCLESELDGLGLCCLSFDCILGPTGLSVHLP
jgi:hypothetical protein